MVCYFDYCRPSTILIHTLAYTICPIFVHKSFDIVEKKIHRAVKSLPIRNLFLIFKPLCGERTFSLQTPNTGRLPRASRHMNHVEHFMPY